MKLKQRRARPLVKIEKESALKFLSIFYLTQNDSNHVDHNDLFAEGSSVGWFDWCV